MDDTNNACIDEWFCCVDCPDVSSQQLSSVQETQEKCTPSLEQIPVTDPLPTVVSLDATIASLASRQLAFSSAAISVQAPTPTTVPVVVEQMVDERGGGTGAQTPGFDRFAKDGLEAGAGSQKYPNIGKEVCRGDIVTPQPSTYRTHPVTEVMPKTMIADAQVVPPAPECGSSVEYRMMHPVADDGSLVPDATQLHDDTPDAEAVDDLQDLPHEVLGDALTLDQLLRDGLEVGKLPVASLPALGPHSDPAVVGGEVIPLAPSTLAS